MIAETIELQEGLSEATLTAYIQEQYDNNATFHKNPAIIICPGGAYLGYTEKEAEPVALRFLLEGFNAFVLRYSVGAMARFPAPLIDTARAVMLIRENTGKWNIDSDRIYLCGFSAGGHVAATYAATWHEGYLSEALNASNESIRPNGLILGYPILDILRFAERNMEKNREIKPLLEMMLSSVFGSPKPDIKLTDKWNCLNRITSYMPMTFMWMTAEDELVDAVEGLDFIKALTSNGVPCEFHYFEKGRHGMSLWAQSEGAVGTNKTDSIHDWFYLAVKWLKGFDRG